MLQTGLNLLTVNSSSDQSTMDDGISPNSEDKRARSEVYITNLQELVGNACSIFLSADIA